MTSVQPPRQTPIQVSMSDLDAPEVVSRASAMEASGGGGLTRNVGTPQPQASNKQFGRSALILAALGLLGGILGFVISELIASPDSDRFTNATMATAIWCSAASFGFALALLSWSGINARSGERVGRDLLRGLPVAILGGAAAGAIAQQIYYPMFESAVKKAIRQADSEAEAFRILGNALHLPRGITFALLGLGLGATLGLAARSVKRGTNAVIGGVVGGFIGGFLFDYVGDWVEADSGLLPRAIAFSIMGTLIGLGIGLVDDLRKDLWLEIVSGGMAGKQFIVWEKRCTIGSGASADITLIKDPAIAPEHFLLVRNGASTSIEILPGMPAIQINGNLVERAGVSDGTLIQVGTTLLRIGQQSATMPTIGKM